MGVHAAQIAFVQRLPAGFVRRERNLRDRRSYAVTITDTGRRCLTEAEASTPAFLDDAFQGLTPAERGQLTALLGKLLKVTG